MNACELIINEKFISAKSSFPRFLQVGNCFYCFWVNFGHCSIFEWKLGVFILELGFLNAFGYCIDPKGISFWMSAIHSINAKKHEFALVFPYVLKGKVHPREGQSKFLFHFDTLYLVNLLNISGHQYRF